MKQSLSNKRAVRSRRILELIRRGMESGVLANCTEFCVDLEISRRTALRDVELLMDDLGAPIEYDAVRKGYLLLESGWVLPDLRLSSREMTALYAMKKYASTFNGTPFESEMVSLLDKMEEGLGAHGAPGSSLIQKHCSIWEDDYAVPEPDNWRILSACIEADKKLQAKYRRFEGEVKEYVLHPYHLVWHHGQWYLLAFHELRSDFASFAVSRIQVCREMDVCFSRRKSFHPERFHEGSFGVSSGRRFMVQLRFSPKVAAFIAERQWHPTQRLKDLPNGGVELAMNTSAWKPLVRFVLSWLPDVEIVKPKKLRDRIQMKMMQSLD